MCYPAMHEPDPAQLERSAPIASLASRAEGLAAAIKSPRPWGSAPPPSASGSSGPAKTARRPYTSGLPPGAPRRLAPEQLARLPALLRRGPEAYGFRGQLWTRKRVAEVIRLEFGIRYHLTHVGRLLQALRGSPQKPMRRARQRDEAAMAHWRTETWPAINKGRKRGSKRSSS